MVCPLVAVAMNRQSEDLDAAQVHTSSGDVEAASWLFEQLEFESGHTISRAMIRKSVEEAAAGLSAPLARTWCQWMLDSCQGLGHRCRAVDCSIEQAAGLVLSGAQIIAYRAEDGWLAIARAQRGRLLVLRPNHDSPNEWMSAGQLRDTLCKTAADGTVRCVVIEPGVGVQSSLDMVDRTPLKRLWELLKPEWPDIWIVMVLALVIGLLTLATPIAVETLVNSVAFGKFLQPVVVLSLMLLTFLTFAGTLRALQTYLVEIIQRRLFARVAADLAYRLPRVQVELLDGHFGRELVNRFFDVVVVQKVAAQLLLDGLLLILGTLIGMAVLAFYHSWLLGFDVPLLAMIALIVLVLGRGAVKSSIKESKTKYRMAAWLEELAGCPTTFRHEGSARFALEQADHLTFEYLTARAQHFRILMRQIIFALAMQAVASTVLLGLGGWLVISGQLTLGQLVAAELIVTVIVGSFAKLGKHMESYYDLLASVDKLGILFDLPVERQDGLISLPAAAGDEVELRGVDYCHPNGQQVLRNFSLTIHAGDRIAITGPSGSGKSTLLDLLFGLRTPTHGRLTMKGVELRELRPDLLRRQIGLVREIEVFEGTVADNVQLGQPHVLAAAARTVLADVGLLDDVLQLPQQLDTPLASTGYPLSSTQLRRLMLARGCVTNPSLLLIDGTLDLLPDQAASALVKWLCRPEQPWKLVLVTGREALAAACNRRVELRRSSTVPGLRQQLVQETGDG